MSTYLFWVFSVTMLHALLTMVSGVSKCFKYVTKCFKYPENRIKSIGYTSFINCVIILPIKPPVFFSICSWLMIINTCYIIRCNYCRQITIHHCIILLRTLVFNRQTTIKLFKRLTHVTSVRYNITLYCQRMIVLRAFKHYTQLWNNLIVNIKPQSLEA